MKRSELFEKTKPACEREYQSYLLCTEIAEKSADPEIRSIFDKIACEAMVNREEIMKQYSKLAPLYE